MYKLDEVAFYRGSPKAEIEDLIFLFRKDESKLQRIERFLNVKKTQQMMKKQIDTEQTTSSSNSTATATAAVVVGTKRKRQSLDGPVKKFLKSLDISTIFFEDEEEEKVTEYKLDELSMRRLTAADAITKNMSVDEYIDYTKCREASFNSQPKKFREVCFFIF